MECVINNSEDKYTTLVNNYFDIECIKEMFTTVLIIITCHNRNFNNGQHYIKFCDNTTKFEYLTTCNAQFSPSENCTYLFIYIRSIN